MMHAIVGKLMSHAFMSTAVCPVGKGDTNGTCIPCSPPAWNDGTSLLCQSTPCGNISFTYPGKLDRLFGGAVTPPGAVGDDQCLSKYSQLYQEQGVYIADPEQFNLTRVNGSMTSVNDCAATCSSSSCQYFTYLYSNDNVGQDSNGTCYIRSTPAGMWATKKLFYKMISTQDLAAQSQVRGKAKSSSTSSGWYVKHATVLGEREQGFNVTNPPNPASSLEDCLLACDFDASCVLVYYDPAAPSTKCSLKAGGPALLLRTAVHGVASKLVQAQKDDNTTCASDSDCFSDACDPVRKVCLPTHCADGIMDADEVFVDCGGADCAPCTGGIRSGDELASPLLHLLVSTVAGMHSNSF
jgi:hypothetical protein